MGEEVKMNHKDPEVHTCHTPLSKALRVILHTRKAWVSKGQKNGKRMLWSRFNLEGNKTFFIVLVRFGNNSKMYVSTSTC